MSTERVVIMRQWAQPLLEFIWTTKAFQNIVQPKLPQPNEVKAKKEMLKERTLATSWTEKSSRYLYGMVSIVPKKDVPFFRKAFVRLMTSRKFGMSKPRAQALFHVNYNPKVVKHIQSTLRDVSVTFGDDFNELLKDLPLGCGRVVLLSEKRKFEDDGDESTDSGAAKKRIHKEWVD